MSKFSIALFKSAVSYYEHPHIFIRIHFSEKKCIRNEPKPSITSFCDANVIRSQALHMHNLLARGEMRLTKFIILKSSEICSN